MAQYRPNGRMACYRPDSGNAGNGTGCGCQGMNQQSMNPRMQNGGMANRNAYMPGGRMQGNSRMNQEERSGGNGCGCQQESSCKDENRHMRHMPVGMCYVPMQEWEELYSACQGLEVGTAFPSLDLEFCGVRGKA